MTRRLYILERVNVRNCFLDIKIYCAKILSGKFAFKSGHSKLELGRVLPEWLGEAVEAQVVQKMTSSHLVVSGSLTKMSPLQRTYASGAEESHCSDGQHQGRAESNCPRSDEDLPKVEKKSRSAWTPSEFLWERLGAPSWRVRSRFPPRSAAILADQPRRARCSPRIAINERLK